GRIASDVVVRRMGNFMRDLFPSYGVYEVLGRLSGHEFAVLTPVSEHGTPDVILQRARCPEGPGEISAFPLTLRVARLGPAFAAAIDELLRRARASVDAVEPVNNGIASPGLAPQPGMTLC